MTPEVAAALVRVREAFRGRAKPLDVEFCHCPACFTDEDMARLFAIPYEELTGDDLGRIVFKAYTTWGTWPDLAYFVPRLLELRVAGTLMDDDMLLYKLLVAARPELATSGADVGEAMTADERRSVFAFEQALFEAEVRKIPYAGSVSLPEWLGFLAMFDAPIEPLLNRWRDSDSAEARANFCLFLADCSLHHSAAHPLLANTYLNKPHRAVLLPENQASLDMITAPHVVSEYLLEHAAEAQLLDTAEQGTISLAFDWAMSKREAVIATP